MLKYSDIINQLSDSDKIRILCDIESLNDKQYRVMGIPAIHVASAERLRTEEYPSPVALANTWDSALIGQTADLIFKGMTEEGIDLVSIPGPKVKINPYRPALSEDPLLATTMATEYLKSAQRFGLSVGLSDFSVSPDELEWTDGCSDARIIYEYFVKPYLDVADAAPCAALLTATDTDKDHLRRVNAELTSALIGSHSELVPVCAKLSADQTVHHLGHGGLCFEGSALALESALARYKQLQKGIEHGSSTTEDLTLELMKGRAISPDMLDEATDRLLDFAFSVKRKPAVSELDASDDVALRAQREAVVLLKNNGALPMKRGLKVCLLGDLFSEIGDDLPSDIENQLTSRGFSVVGTSRGYDLSSERSEDLIPPAIALAEQADLTLLFLGLGKHREKRTVKSGKISIPANQQELLDRLGGCKSKVVAILPPECCPDVSIPESCAAILLSPLNTKLSASVLCEILSGETNPSGKLASTVYCHTEALYSEYKTYKIRDGLKTGPFIGYRYYDTAGTLPGFSFGHGLSYTKFSYSQLTVSNGQIRFTVTNSGKVAGAEVAQVYIGKADSAVLRPCKELAGFTRIELKAGEKKTVQIPLSLPKVYDAKAGSFAEEQGSYTVFVGSSVTDVRLTQKITGGNAQIEADGQNLSDYIQSESNIITDNFKLEAKFKAMKKSVFNYISGALAFLLAIVLKMYCAYNDVNERFFDIFAIVLGIAGIVFFVVEAIRRNRIHSEERKHVDELSREEFSDAESIPVYSADQMFVKEFDTATEENKAVVEDRIDGVEPEQLAFVDKDQSFEAAARDFALFASERGCSFAPETVINVFASLASSRLLVVNGMEEKAFKKFMLILSSYFETAVYIDRADATYSGSESVLFKTDANGGRAKTNALSAIESARNIKHAIHFAALDNVTASALPAYFTPYIGYVKNPLGNSHVTVLNENNAETSYYIPRNLWFVLNLAKGETPDSIPDFISEVAVVNRFDFRECQSTAQHTHVRKFSYYQLEHLTEKAVTKTTVSEDDWKKVDKLEEFINKRTPFSIGNKVWLRLEKYAYVYITCGGDTIDALDRAVCAKLMSAVIAAMKGKISGDEKSLDETVEMILGEDRANACKSLIKECSARS
ncbi:MAG: glycoside hydrolase family 3 C-terminal domain-containing protein [Clostridia bacterium]|nr:glycoside hydrolase family 3 C-terminal domain-containing protein [Clostridia bacterium]